MYRIASPIPAGGHPDCYSEGSEASRLRQAGPDDSIPSLPGISGRIDIDLLGSHADSPQNTRV